MRPRCFSKAILYYGAPLSSTGSTRAVFPGVIGTIRALRLPAPTTELLIDSLPRSNRSSPRSLPCGRESRRAWSRSSPVPLATSRLVKHRSSQVPGESIPYFRPALGSRPVHRSSPWRHDDAVPTLRTVKTLTSRRCRDSITRLQYLLPTLQARCYHGTCKARFRPVASPCREGVEPSGFQLKVSVHYIGRPPFPGLSWRYRKSPARASAKKGLSRPPLAPERTSRSCRLERRESLAGIRN
jgi:hypothetical protein